MGDDVLARAEYIKCVLRSESPKKTWCGRTPYMFEYTFVSKEHALAAEPVSVMTICPACKRAIEQEV
jgi:hypothetical protein